ncbi:MAG TPA: peptide chain release factor 2 [Terriglobia bacterium]|nr:peptide chain release factor 2 [Terriglobia bacterium]
MIEELEREYDVIKRRAVDLRGYLDAARLSRELSAIEKQMADPGFWQNPGAQQEILPNRRRLEEALQSDRELEQRVADLDAYFELAREGENVEAEIRQEMNTLRESLDRLETASLLAGENDRLNAIVTIHPGAGGTESQDWAEMLLRMYRRWAERHGFQFNVLDYQAGEEAGLKSATFAVNGDYAYGLLASEIGVHRLVRISPFDAAKRRHTSFASVFVSPEIDENIEIEIKPDEIRTETYRSTGAGGQHVNTTDSAVRIVHLPTGVIATCQNERSQHRNREMAMKVLRSKLYELELEKRREESKKLEDLKGDIAFGNQVRSYVLHPYRMVKDHRTKFEMGDADRVLDGDIDPFIKAYLLSRRTTAVAEK